MKTLMKFIPVICGVLFLSSAVAADKVVVIPLNSKGNKPEPEVPVVISATGQVWMALNLGASQVAISSDDPAAYGTLYQWGRLGDGHEYRSSAITTTLSSGDVPGHGSFITAAGFPYDWRSSPNDNLWQGESGINNPCPAGFRLPTTAEWETEMASWGNQNAAGAFASPLKLVLAGYRDYYDGTLLYAGSDGFYWSSTVVGSYSRSLYFGSGNANMDSTSRAYGVSVRCLKD